MRKLISELRYYTRLNYQIKAIAFAKSPMQVRKIVLFIQTIYMQLLLGSFAQILFGVWAALIVGAAAAVLSVAYFVRLESDGMQAIAQVEAMESAMVDAGIPFHHQYPDHVEGVEDGQDPSRV